MGSNLFKIWLKNVLLLKDIPTYTIPCKITQGKYTHVAYTKGKCTQYMSLRGDVPRGVTQYQTWDLSKILHDQIFEPEILHRKSALIGIFLLTSKQQKCIYISNLSYLRYNSTLCVKFSVNSHLVSVNLELLREFCKKRRCFLDKFTQLAKILHDRRSCKVATNLNSAQCGSTIVKSFHSFWI